MYVSGLIAERNSAIATDQNFKINSNVYTFHLVGLNMTGWAA